MSVKDLLRMQGYDLDAMEAELVKATSRVAKAEDKNEELQKLVASMEKELSAAKARIVEMGVEILALREMKRQLEESLREMEARCDDPIFLRKRLSDC